MIPEMDTPEGGFSRRGFLGRLAGGSTAVMVGLTDTRAAFANTLQSMRATAAEGGSDGGYWEKVRKQFMLEDGFAYLNTGTLGPTPRPVWEAMNEYWRLMAVNPNENSAVFQNHVEQIRT